jgi:transcriptional regulator with XRE-family HTH domain
MAETPAWAIRLRQHMDEHGVSARQLSERMSKGSATVGHYLNGTRDPGVLGFIALCEAAGADPAFILVGRHYIPEEVRRAAKTLTAALETDPTANKNYSAMSKSLKKKA